MSVLNHWGKWCYYNYANNTNLAVLRNKVTAIQALAEMQNYTTTENETPSNNSIDNERI
jgi:hypothetical protein